MKGPWIVFSFLVLPSSAFPDAERFSSEENDEDFPFGCSERVDSLYIEVVTDRCAAGDLRPLVDGRLYIIYNRTLRDVI